MKFSLLSLSLLLSMYSLDTSYANSRTGTLKTSLVASVGVSSLIFTPDGLFARQLFDKGGDGMTDPTDSPTAAPTTTDCLLDELDGGKALANGNVVAINSAIMTHAEWVEFLANSTNNVCDTMGVLVSIDTEEKTNVTKAMVVDSEIDYIIGGFRNPLTDELEWLSGATIPDDSPSWAPGQPSGQDCMEIRDAGWFDFECNVFAKRAIVEYAV